MLVAVHAPGALPAFPKNLGITLTAVLTGNLFFIGVTTVVFDAANSDDPSVGSGELIDPGLDGKCVQMDGDYYGTSCYTSTFIVFAAFGAVGLGLAAWVAILVCRKG